MLVVKMGVEYRQILDHTVIPVVEIESANQAIPLAEAILQGGGSILEVVLRTDEAINAIKIIRRQCPDMLVGAGTVLTSTQADQVIDAGAQFGITPGFNLSVVERFRDNDLPIIPGVMTPSEITTALDNDCQFLKFFPAEASGGIRYLKSIAGPFEHSGVRFCATGGIDLNNMNDYLALPVVNSVGGSWLASRQQIQHGQWQQITDQVSASLRSPA